MIAFAHLSEKNFKYVFIQICRQKIFSGELDVCAGGLTWWKFTLTSTVAYSRPCLVAEMQCNTIGIKNEFKILFCTKYFIEG